MKRLLQLIIFFLIPGLCPATAQLPAGKFLLETKSRRYKAFIETDGQRSIIYWMGGILDKAGIGYWLRGADTISAQPETDVSRSTATRLVLQKNRLKLALLNPGRLKMMYLRVDTVTLTGSINYQLNNGYWWQQFIQLCHQMDSLYPGHHHSFRRGFIIWKGIENQEMRYLDFKPVAHRCLQAARDSMVSMHAGWQQLQHDMMASLQQPDSASLRHALQTLYDEEHGPHFKAIANALCLQQPALFLQLAGRLPQVRHFLFYVVDNPEAINRIRTLDTPYTDLKKEFLKERRK